MATTNSTAAKPLTMRQFADLVIALLRTQPAGTGLKDGDTGSEFFMEGEGLFACQIDEPRADGAIDLDDDAWDSARGCWDGGTPEQTMAVIESPEFLPPRAAPAPKVLDIIRTASRDCRALDNTAAANELLDACAMTADLLTALRGLQANPNDPRAHRVALDAIAYATTGSMA